MAEPTSTPYPSRPPSPPANTTTSTSTSTRPRILYPDSGPEAPYPLRMEGRVISGFGRGSKDLGIPTANLPVDGDSSASWIGDARSGVYFGWASLALPDDHPDHISSSPIPTSSSSAPNTEESAAAAKDEKEENKFQIYPMVMSIGYNPFYKNAVRSAEVHLLHRFAADFYGSPMRLLVLGFVRDERDYADLDALVSDIRVDCDVARQSLARAAWTPSQGVILGPAGGQGEGAGVAKGTLDGSWLVR
ncbi:hypothetical protein F5Y17DRAFT_25512 [Xylariaceae sp. FL0594]|nr:hypothetical protein F5Y17DRAFT_25512 [Xylariaceae sp. FL0594]